MTEFKELIIRAFKKEAIKKLIFSKSKVDGVLKTWARLCAHRGKRILSTESALRGSTVSQRNVREEELSSYLDTVMSEFEQINLITTMGEAELRITKKGKVAKLGADKLLRKLSGEVAVAEVALETLDRKKTYILTGSEDFLIKLGISDKSGRVHDKKQGKFRQINKFLEYIEEIYKNLPSAGKLNIYDLCCGKSYLSFAVYYYLTEVKKRDVNMLGVDLKRDVIEFCDGMAREMGFVGMRFITDDIMNLSSNVSPDMVISLHACDIATDIVLKKAAELSATVILSTPCCHKNLADKISAKELSFVTKYPKLKGKLCEAITDALRLELLAAYGYEVSATELVDPEDTPKNTLLRAIKRGSVSQERLKHYEELLKALLGEKWKNYIQV